MYRGWGAGQGSDVCQMHAHLRKTFKGVAEVVCLFCPARRPPRQARQPPPVLMKELGLFLGSFRILDPRPWGVHTQPVKIEIDAKEKERTDPLPFKAL